MSQRRKRLLTRFCSRRCSGLNLTNSEVNGKTNSEVNGKPRRKRGGKRTSSKCIGGPPRTNPRLIPGRRRAKPEDASIEKALHQLAEAGALHARGQSGKAEHTYNELIHFCKQNISSKRYETALAFNDLGVLHFNCLRIEKAKPLFQKALAILEKTVGEAHPFTQTVRENLAFLRSKAEIG